MKPNATQLAGQLRTALAAGGPIAAVILAKTGLSQEDYALYLELFLYVVPPVIAAVWSYLAKRDAALVKATNRVKGTTVLVDTATADPAVTKVAHDDAHENVRPQATPELSHPAPLRSASP